MNREELYDCLCIILDTHFKSYNHCNIQLGKDGRFTCAGKSVCCGDCEYLSYEGCTISCLGCKLYICYTLQKENPELKEFLKELTKIAKANDLIRMWTPKEELFK